PWDAERVQRWLPAGFYGGGSEHVQRHHLYARFVCMALHDLGHLPFAEPFPVIRLGGLITHAGARMSKSRGNVVNPDDYWAEHGRDVLRCALLFSGPWDRDGSFHDRNITGIERFFGRAWRTVDRVLGESDIADPAGPGPQAEALDRAVREVTGAITKMRHNVALARLMELQSRVRSVAGARTFTLLLAPLAPYLAEELWARLGGEVSVQTQPWPTAAEESA
ncbi:MAG: class I tRNA ligase family protein, partial [Acidimicrobiales bacterium]